MHSGGRNERCSCCLEEHPKISRMKNNIPNTENSGDNALNVVNDGMENNNMTKMNKARSTFTDFCHSTSLHGWQHLTETHHHHQTSGKYMWVLIVVASIGVASFFLFTSVDDFTSKYVVTNIDTTTAPLNVSIDDGRRFN